MEREATRLKHKLQFWRGKGRSLLRGLSGLLPYLAAGLSQDVHTLQGLSSEQPMFSSCLNHLVLLFILSSVLSAYGFYPPRHYPCHRLPYTQPIHLGSRYTQVHDTLRMLYIPR